MSNILYIKTRFSFWLNFSITRLRIKLINTFSNDKKKISFNKERVGDRFLYYKTPLKGLLKKYKLNKRIKYKGEYHKGFTEKECIEQFHIYNISTYQNSKNEKELWNKSVFIYQERAKNGIPEAYNNLGILYCYGDDNLDFKKCFELAAESGSSEAMLNLAFTCYSDKTDQLDKVKYFYWLNRAALKENPIALYNYGVSYHFGLDVEKNLSLAVDYYKKAIYSSYKNKDSDLFLKKIKKMSISNLILMTQK